MKRNFYALLILTVIACCLSFTKTEKDTAITKAVLQPVVLDGYYVDGNVTVHVEVSTAGGGHITNVTIIDSNNNDLNVTSKMGSASVSSGIITLSGFSATFKW